MKRNVSTCLFSKSLLASILFISALGTTPVVYAKKSVAAKSASSIDGMSEKELLAMAKQNFEALPASLIDVKKNKDLIGLGQRLYFEKKLSINNTIACNSCHLLDKYGVDGTSTSSGHDGSKGDRNAPTVYNAALNFVQFWDGRAKDVEEQALGPILNPIEHGMPSEEAVVKKLSEDAEYVASFQKAFKGQKDALNYKNIGVAIGAFERTLLTPSRFDDWLKGKTNALTITEKRGMKKFMETGCTACHTGVNIGGTTFQKLGLVEEYKTKDTGRFHVTKSDEDKFFFKVPTLRNIEHTGPYFHDGSLSTLDEVIKVMGKHQLGATLTDEDVSLIKAFFSSLSAKKLPKFK